MAQFTAQAVSGAIRISNLLEVYKLRRYILNTHPDRYELTNVWSTQRAILENIAKVLAASGSSLKHILKANVYLTDMKDFAAMNEEYMKVLLASNRIWANNSLVPTT
jgi:hypothetical protein